MSDDSSQRFDRRTFLKASGAAGAAAALGGVTAATPGREPGPKKDEIVVGVSAGAGDVEGTVAQHVPGNAEIVHKNDTLRYVSVKFPEQAADTARRNFVEAVTKKDGIEYAEPHAPYEALYVPNDPEFPNQYVPQQVGADDAWDTTLGSHDVTVAVVDQGIQYDHSDLDGNFVGDKGYDFVDRDDDPYPDACSEAHGTQVAGIIAAETGNGTDVAGLGQSRLLSCRALDEGGGGSLTDIADAIQWAADQGAEVINLSLGGGYSDTLKNAVLYAVNNGSLPVAAAGASGTRDVSYPAAFDECVAVSTVNDSEQLASFSSYGPEIELCAPGVDVLTLSRTCSSGDTQRMSGTSFSTAAVSGVAGLTLARWGLNVSELRSHLTDTAKDLGLPTDEQGAGQVDAHAAVTTDPFDGGTSPVTKTYSGTLSGERDYDDREWSWRFGDPRKLTVELDGPSGADFDLYVNEGTTTPASPRNYDYRSIDPDSQELVSITDPDTSTPLQIDVDSYSGSGSYDLIVTEYE